MRWQGGEESLWVNPAFPEQADSMTDGIYRSEGECGGFRAGSYSGYNEWRRQLAEQVGGYSDESAFAEAVDPPKPFEPLVNFSDCEGVIGPKTSARLAKDFADHQAKADEIGGWFAEQYANWRNAFETAAKGGAVQFH